MSRHERKLAYLSWLVVCFVWGTTYLGIRVALETVPVALLAGVRWAAAELHALERAVHPRAYRHEAEVDGGVVCRRGHARGRRDGPGEVERVARP